VASLTAVQLWEMIDKSALVYPDPIAFHAYLTRAHKNILKTWYDF
jgi:hypothetical protein